MISYAKLEDRASELNPGKPLRAWGTECVVVFERLRSILSSSNAAAALDPGLQVYCGTYSRHP
jgi:hypothetical protein